MPLGAVFFDFDRMLVDWQPQDCAFIGDALHNCLGPKAAGKDGSPFLSQEQLDAALHQRRLLRWSGAAMRQRKRVSSNTPLA